MMREWYLQLLKFYLHFASILDTSWHVMCVEFLYTQHSILKGEVVHLRCTNTNSKSMSNPFFPCWITHNAHNKYNTLKYQTCFIDVLVLYTITTCTIIMGWDSSVGIVTRYGLDGLGLESEWGRDYPHPSRPALGHSQPPIQWVQALSQE